MNRISEFRSAGLRAAAIVGFALLLAAPRPAAAQGAPAAAPQEDPLKFSASQPSLMLIQIHAEKAADFESAWTALRAGLAKSSNADHKAFGETIGKLWKVDQPPLDGPGGKSVLYVLQLDNPSTTVSYNPFKVVYEILWNADEKLSLITRAEADSIYEKLKASFININPPWKLVKAGG